MLSHPYFWTRTMDWWDKWSFPAGHICENLIKWSAWKDPSSLHICIENVRFQEQCYRSAAWDCRGWGRTSLLLQKYWVWVRETARVNSLWNAKYTVALKRVWWGGPVSGETGRQPPQGHFQWPPGLQHSFLTRMFLRLLAQLISPNAMRVMAKYHRTQSWPTRAGSSLAGL